MKSENIFPDKCYKYVVVFITCYNKNYARNCIEEHSFL